MKKEKIRHIAIIMDGNGRWAKKRLLPNKLGHREGAKVLKKITEYCDEIGLQYLTVYAFSTENWNRSEKEVDDLMALLSEFLDEYISNNDKNNIVIKVIGDKNRLEKSIVEKICTIEKLSENKKGVQLNLAINYGGRDEIVRSVKKICEDVSRGKVREREITEKLFSSYLDTKEIIDPEILIRTSGESRVSNFLLWQIAYTEIFNIKKLWPDFNKKDIDEVIKEFKNRNRTFGER